MIRLASSANKQFLDLIDHYLERGFDEAAERLTAALEQAEAEIAADPMIGKDFPAVHRTLVWPNVKWVKVHRYWFSYMTVGDPVIFNILWDTADIPSRAVAPNAGDLSR